MNLAYLSAALLSDALPGWKMFETVEHVNYVLRNSKGELVDVHSVLPRSANLIDKAQLRRVVAFICEHQPGPFWFQEAVLALEVLIPLLLCSRWARWGLAVAILLHTGFALALPGIFTFSLTMWAMAALFIGPPLIGQPPRHITPMPSSPRADL